MQSALAVPHVDRIPEDKDAVQAFDRALRQNRRAVLEHAAEVKAYFAARKVTTLDGIGWPLRPLFLPRHIVDFIGRSIHIAFDETRKVLLDRADDTRWLAANVPVRREMFKALDLRAGLESPAFLAITRPDGFVLENGFLLTEVNFGNGTIVSNAYSETLFRLFKGSPALQAAGLDVTRGILRPFPSMVKMLKGHLKSRKKRHLVALLAHDHEHKTILSWEERVIQAVYFAQAMMRRAGVHTEIVHEDGLTVGSDGRTRLLDGRAVDAVMMMTIGTSFMDEPRRLQKGDLKELRGERVGKVPLIKPLASLLMDKGTMPMMARELSWPRRSAEGFHFDLASTAFPEEKHAPEYRHHPERYVLKRAFDGKDTVMGVTTPGREWNAKLQRALETKDYIIQEYVPLPRTTMPVCIDGKHIEWIDVRVELSPFVINGRFAGAIARYAPDAEGLILSPPPTDMGMTMVHAV